MAEYKEINHSATDPQGKVHNWIERKFEFDGGKDWINIDHIRESSQYSDWAKDTFIEWIGTQEDLLIPQNLWLMLEMLDVFGDRKDPFKYLSDLVEEIRKFENLPEEFIDPANDLVIEESGGHLNMMDSDGDAHWWKIFFMRHQNINTGRYAREFMRMVETDPNRTAENFFGEINGYLDFEKKLETLIPLSEQPGETLAERNEKIKMEQKRKVVEMAEMNGGFLYILAVHYFYGGNEDELLKIKFDNTPESWERLDKARSFGFQCLDKENQTRILAKNPKIEDWDEKEEGWKKSEN